MNQQSLADLGLDYQRQAETLRAQIARRRERLHEVLAAGDQKAVYLLECELRTLYAQCRDADATAAYLTHYYDPLFHRKGFLAL